MKYLDSGRLCCRWLYHLTSPVLISLILSELASLLADGQPQLAASAGGIRAAFVWGAVLSTLAVVAAFFVRKPAESPLSP